MNKGCRILSVVIAAALSGSVLCQTTFPCEAETTDTTSTNLAEVEAADIRSADSEEEYFLRRGQTTVIQYDKQYDAYVDSANKAGQAISEFGNRQSSLYENPQVKAIEEQMESDYGILAVNLGEMDPDTAIQIEDAFSYMYREYPILYGTLTNLTLANFPNEQGNNLAVTQTREFMINEIFGRCPFVVKYEILLNASKFLNPERMEADYEKQTANGHWPVGTNTTSIVVHELGHQLQDVIKMKQFGLYEGETFTGYYITEENADAYSAFITDALSVNQTVSRKMVEDAYEVWLSDYDGDGDQETFRGSISEYAAAIQPDGGISYGETISEAIADIYLHGETAVPASKAILQIVKQELELQFRCQFSARCFA